MCTKNRAVPGFTGLPRSRLAGRRLRHTDPEPASSSRIFGALVSGGFFAARMRLGGAAFFGIPLLQPSFGLKHLLLKMFHSSGTSNLPCPRGGDKALIL